MDVMKEDESSEDRRIITDSGSPSLSSSAKEVGVQQAVKPEPSPSSPSDDCGKSDDLTRCQLDNQNGGGENSLKTINGPSDKDPKTMIAIAAASVLESSTVPFPEPDPIAQLDPLDTAANGIKRDSISSNSAEVSEVARRDLCSDSLQVGGGKGSEVCASGELEMNIDHSGNTHGNPHPGEQWGNFEHGPAAGSIQELSRENTFPTEIHSGKPEATASVAKTVESGPFVGPAMIAPMLRSPVGEQESPDWATSNDVRARAAEKVDGDWLGTVEGAEAMAGAGDHSNGVKGAMATDLAGEDSNPSRSGAKHPASSTQEADADDPASPATLCEIGPGFDSASLGEKGRSQQMKEGGIPHSTFALEGTHECQDSSESVTTDSKSDAEAVEPDERVAGDSTLLPARTGGPEAAKVVAPAGSQVEACGAEDDAWSTAVTVDANEEDFGDLALLPAGPDATDVAATGEGDELGNEAGITSRETGTTSAARGVSPTKTVEWDPKGLSKPKGTNEGVRGSTPCLQMQPVASTELKSTTHASDKGFPASQGASESATNGRVADDWVKFGGHDLLNTSAAKHEDPESLAAQSPPFVDDKGKNVASHPACGADASAPAGGGGDDDWGAFVEVPPPGSTFGETVPEHAVAVVDSMSAEESAIAQKDASQSRNDKSGSAAVVAMNEDGNRAHEGDAKTAVLTEVDEKDSHDQQEEDWGDFGDFEEAPTTLPEPPAGVPPETHKTGQMSPDATVHAVGVEKEENGSRVSENGSDWNAFKEPAAIQAPAPTQNGQTSSDVPAATARLEPSTPKSPAPDRTLAIYVAVFNHAFPGEESSGTGVRKAPPQHGDPRGVPLEALVSEAVITRYSKRWRLLPKRLGKSARLCILRGICPVADSLCHEDSDVDIEDVTEISAERKARAPPIAAAEADEGVGAVREVRRTSLPVPPPGPAESPTLPTQASPARRDPASDITPGTSEMKYQSSPGVKSPVVEEPGQPSGRVPSASNTGDEISTSPSPKEAVSAVRASSSSSEVPATAPSWASQPLTTLHAGENNSQPPEQSKVDAAKESSVGHETNDSTSAEDWSGDPFDDFQSAPPVPESKAIESASFNLISTLTPQPEKASTTETPTWTLDFFMSGPSSNSAGTKSSDGGLTGKSDEPEAAGGISKKPLDLVSQALAGYGIADSPFSVSTEAISHDLKQVSLPRGSEPETRDEGRASSPTPTPAVDSGANPLADLLRATRNRGNVNVAPLSAPAKSRISALPDLSFMLSGRLKFPVVGTISSAASDSE